MTKGFTGSARNINACKKGYLLKEIFPCRYLILSISKTLKQRLTKPTSFNAVFLKVIRKNLFLKKMKCTFKKPQVKVRAHPYSRARQARVFKVSPLSRPIFFINCRVILQKKI